VDAAHYMPGAVLAKVDRMSMQHSLEVRAPLIGREIALFAEKLAASHCYAPGHGKLVLKRVAERYVPAEWLARPKRGFGLPMDLWGRNELLPPTESRVLAPEGRLRQWIEPERLKAFLAGQGRDFNAYRVWALFILENWMRNHPIAHDMPVAEAQPFAARRTGLFARARTMLGLTG
jgi:asparagine synthase (glutamine-hydrolysing)